VTKQVNGTWQVVARHDFMPFGEEVAPQTPPPDKRLFTGKERDNETGLDYFEARYLGASRGRFTTIDPLITFDENLVDPQRWNRYSYARQNPLRWLDPMGLWLSTCSAEDADCLDAEKRFEEARREALRSKNPWVRSAARAFGNLGDRNDVFVSFNLAKDGPYGGTVQLDYMKVKGRIDVQINPSLKGKDLEQAIVHEGVHVEQAFDYLAAGRDPRLNLTVEASELDAFSISAAVKPYDISWIEPGVGFKNFTFGPSSGERETIRLYLAWAPGYRGRLRNTIWPR